MRSPNDDLFDLPSVPRVRKASSSTENVDKDASSSAPRTGRDRPRKQRRRSRWSDAAPSEISAPQLPSAVVPAETSDPADAGRHVDVESLMKPSSRSNDSPIIPPPSPPPSRSAAKTGKKRGRRRKVVNDDDDDDDDDYNNNEENYEMPEPLLDEEKHEMSSPEIRPTTKKSKSKKSKKNKKKKTKKPVEKYQEEEEMRQFGDEPLSPGALTPISDAESPSGTPSAANGGRGRLTSRQRAMQGEKVDLEYGKLDSPKHKKKAADKDEWTQDEESELKRVHRQRLRQMVNERRSKEKRAATVDKVLRGVSSKRKKITVENEAVAARAGDRLLNKGVPEGFVRFSSGPNGSSVAVHPGAPLPGILSLGPVKAVYPRACTRDPRTGKRVFTEI